jgi:hypothetical protein
MPAKKPKPLPKKKRQSTRTTDPGQSARFLEMAKKLEVDESGEAFERAINVIVPPPRKPKPK